MESNKPSDDFESCKTSFTIAEEIPFTTLDNELNSLSNGNVNYNSIINERQKRIDFVLVFRNKDENFLENSKARNIFETNLQEEGLMIEYKESIGNSEYSYVHIFAPWDLLTRYAEVMKLRMPMKTIRSNLKILFDEEYSRDSMIFTAPYSSDKEYLFDIPEDKEQFFTKSQRAQIVEFILKRKSFSSNATDVFSIGINKLLSDNVYSAAYPLHEGKLNEDIDSTRSQLIKNWASLSCLHKNQPLDQIAQYFGVKIAIYFAWVGFYTKMLIPASIVGIICFTYGALTLKYDLPTNQVCNNSSDVYMCPICAKNCNITLLSESCTFMRASYLFDNPSTVVFAIFMSLWATFYLEMWKRYSAKVTYKWDLTEFDAIEEYPRPEYLARLTNRNTKSKVNLITRMQEPYIPFFRGKLPHIIVSSSLVFLCIILALAIMVSIIAYRVSVQIAIDAYDKDSVLLQKYGSIFTSLTAALINLICILILNQIYMRLAFFLTERELPRTQTEFDNSLTLKMYLFEFVNYYSSIFYIAFFKGKFVGHPGEPKPTIAEECPTGGCFLDLAIQLAIIMVGKQALSAIIEISAPIFMRLYNMWKYTSNIETNSSGELNLPQWEEDFVLESWGPTSLFYEYLELVVQFGFVTVFVSAFPLAPLFALINNFFEIRFDAKKIITNFKRPVAQRVKSIGIWYRILDAVGKLSVITNAIIIAFSTSFVPRVLYYIENGNLENYLNSTLSFYRPDIPNSTYCVYTDYREPPWTESQDQIYSRTTYFWRLMVARLAFVVIFENVIVLFTSMMRVLIPDVPKQLRLQKRQHSYLTNEIIMRQEFRLRKRISARL